MPATSKIAVRGAPETQFRMTVKGSCDALRVQVESAATPYADQLAIFVATAVSGARPPDSPLLPTENGVVAFGELSGVEASMLEPNTSYSVWSSVRQRAGWSGWGMPRHALTTRPTQPPHPPQPPDVVTATACDEVRLRLPARVLAGCATAELLELQMLVAGYDWRATSYQQAPGGVVSVSQARQDPLQTVEFRMLARNRLGVSPSESTGPISSTVSLEGLLKPIAVSATSSQSMHLDWSAMAPLGCKASVTWQVFYRRSDDAGDAWQVLERNHQHTVYRPMIDCHSGCSFKVLPNLVGWTQTSAASAPTSTLAMPAIPPPPAIRLRLRLDQEAFESQNSASALLRAFEEDLQEGLAVSAQQIRAIELRTVISPLKLLLNPRVACRLSHILRHPRAGGAVFGRRVRPASLRGRSVLCTDCTQQPRSQDTFTGRGRWA